jgi:hypothetical protein
MLTVYTHGEMSTSPSSTLAQDLEPGTVEVGTFSDASLLMSIQRTLAFRNQSFFSVGNTSRPMRPATPNELSRLSSVLRGRSFDSSQPLRICSLKKNV